jgi:hypothetical protein
MAQFSSGSHVLHQELLDFSAKLKLAVLKDDPPTHPHGAPF